MNAMASVPEEVVQEIVSHCLIKRRMQRQYSTWAEDLANTQRSCEQGIKSNPLDTPETIDYVSSEFELADIRNLTLKKGDFMEDKFVNEFEELFDIVFMGNITHIYSEDVNRSLLMRVSRLLNKGGMVAIEDFVRGRSPYAEMFAVNMLANTQGGGTWTEEQYRKWLKDAGFSNIEVLDLADKKTAYHGFPGEIKDILTKFQKTRSYSFLSFVKYRFRNFANFGDITTLQYIWSGFRLKYSW